MLSTPRGLFCRCPSKQATPLPSRGGGRPARLGAPATLAGAPDAAERMEVRAPRGRRSHARTRRAACTRRCGVPLTYDALTERRPARVACVCAAPPQVLGADALLRYPFDVWMTSSEAPRVVAAAPMSVTTTPVLSAADATAPPPRPLPLLPRFAGRACRVPGCTSSAEDYRTYNIRCRRDEARAAMSCWRARNRADVALCAASSRARAGSARPACARRTCWRRAARASASARSARRHPRPRARACAV
jgi:hypothetical protein